MPLLPNLSSLTTASLARVEATTALDAHNRTEVIIVSGKSRQVFNIVKKELCAVVQRTEREEKRLLNRARKLLENMEETALLSNDTQMLQRVVEGERELDAHISKYPLNRS